MGRAALVLVVVWAILAIPRPARAADPPPPPPFEFRRKPRLSDEDYLRKKEGPYLTGLPLASYDPNTGVGLGAAGFVFVDGTRADPLFAYTPYQHRLFAQVFFTTGGLQSHWVDYDAPALGGSPWRVRAQGYFERNTSLNYFGIGERAHDLRVPGGAGTFDDLARYQDALAQLGGASYARYDKLDLCRPGMLGSIERSLLGGVMRSFFGLGVAHATVRDHAGAVERTRLGDDCARGAIRGCGGGWDNIVRVALALDTRDFEPDPNSGVFADLAADFGTRLIGSRYDYVRLMLAVRGYVSPFPRLADLVLASRGVYEVQSAGVPFFSMNTLPFTEDVRTGLGGVRSLRGYRENRFVGHVMALTNHEIRWTFARTTLAGERFAFIAVPFVDLGRVWGSVRRTSFARWNRSQGLGLRVAWNLSTLIAIDYGFSDEDAGLYINFGHIF